MKNLGLEKVEPLTNNRWLNLYESTIKTTIGERTYYFASRRKPGNLGCENMDYVDAVKVLPYFIKDGTKYIILNYEYRSPVASRTYDLCAGLVEHQDNIEEDVRRELYEEVGATVKSIQKAFNAGHTTAGLTDEKIVGYFAEIDELGEQHLEDDEDIERVIISVDEIPQFLEDNEVGATGNLMLQVFYLQNQLEANNITPNI